MRTVSASMLVLVLVGCRHYVRPSDLPPRPGPSDVVRLTDRWAEGALRDPYTAIIRGHGAPIPGYSRGPFMTVGRPGWLWNVSVNARNGFGGYVGTRNYWILYTKGRIYGAAGNWDLTPWSFLCDLGPFVAAKGWRED